MRGHDYDCLADSSLFHMAQKDIPRSVLVHIPKNGLPCNFNGVKGAHCGACPFGRERYTPGWFDSAYEDEDRFQFGDHS
jgi:hypothetical protein